MDTRTPPETSTLPTHRRDAGDQELAYAIGRLYGVAKDASRTTPGTAEHANCCGCWSCRLGDAVKSYEEAMDRHNRYYPGGDPVVVPR